MPFVIGLLVAAIAAVALAWWLAALPGAITLTLAGYTIETSTALALVALAVLIAAILLVLRILSWILGSGTRVGRWQQRRRRDEGDRAVTAALVALAAGDSDRAQRESARARRRLGDTPQTLLLAAQSARLAGDEALAAELYRLLASREDAALLGWRGLLRQAMARDDFPEAAALAARAEAAHPGAPWLREERGLLAVRTGDWRAALRLAAPDAPRAAFAVAAAQAAVDPAEGTALARQAAKAHPDFAPATLAYARRLRDSNRESRAQDVLRDGWTASPQPDIAAFALLTAADAGERLRRAVRLVSGRADHPESHLLLARLHLESGGLVEARRQLDAARRGGLDQRRLWVLQADLESREGADNAATLRRAAEAPADPAWRCESCGTIQGEWRPVCPQCHVAGRVAWRQPARTELVAQG